MATGTTPKYGLLTYDGNELGRSIDNHHTTFANQVDSKMVGDSQGPIGSRPVLTGGCPASRGAVTGRRTPARSSSTPAPAGSRSRRPCSGRR